MDMASIRRPAVLCLVLAALGVGLVLLVRSGPNAASISSSIVEATGPASVPDAVIGMAPDRNEVSHPTSRTLIVTDGTIPVAGANVFTLDAAIAGRLNSAVGSPDVWRASLMASPQTTTRDGRCPLPALPKGSLAFATRRGFCASGVVIDDSEGDVLLALSPGLTLHGSVADGRGGPIGDASIRTTLLQDHPWAVEHPSPSELAAVLFSPSAVSDATGTFVLDHVVATTQLLAASKAGHASHNYCWDPSEGTEGLQFVLYEGSIRVNGTVRDEATGSPLEAVLIRGFVKQSDVRYYDNATCWTDAAGAFDLDGLVADVEGQGLLVTKDGYATETIRIERRAAGSVAAMTIALRAPRLQRGRVVGSDGSPVPKAYVRVFEAETRDPREWTIADGSGAFELRRQAEGDAFRLIVAADGFVDAEAGPFVNAPDTDLVVRLVRAGAIRGRLRTTGGLPVAGSVRLTSANSDGAPAFDRTLSCSGANGEFAFEELEHRTYRLVANAADMTPAIVDGIAVDADHPTHDFPLEMTPGHHATLDVRAADTGDPIVDARLVLFDPAILYWELSQFGLEARTDAHGLGMIGPLPRLASLGVRVFAGNYVTQSVILAPKADADLSASVRLQPGGIVGVRIVGRDGKSIPAMEAWIEPLAAGEVTDLFPPDTMSFLGLPQGPASVGARILRHEDPVLRGMEFRRTITVEPGTNQLVEFRLGEGARVHGRCILPAAGDAPQRFRVTLEPKANEPAMLTVPTGLDGRFDVPGVAPGAWSLAVGSLDLPYALLGSVDFTIAEGEDKTIELRFGECGISGTVVGPDGRPPTGAHFECFVGREGIKDDTISYGWQGCDVDASGRFEILGLAQGEYFYDLRAPGYAIEWGRFEIVGAGAQVQRDFTLKASASVVVHVVDSEGSAITDAEVKCEPMVTSLPNKVILADIAARFQGLDAAGDHRFDQVAAGEYVVTATRTGSPPVSTRIRAANGEVVRCELVVGPTK